MFKVVNLRNIVAIVVTLIISCGITLGLYKVTTTNAQPKFNYTIVVDAGHGGRDAGCSGINTGVSESEINLAIAKKLQKYLSDFGFNVVMTRDSQNGLYSPTATNFKKSDMERREAIINECGADLLVSIHQNSYPSTSEKGAQVFYNEDNSNSLLLSQSIQSQLKKNLNYARENPHTGDYFILKTKDIPSALVECGFLSNPEEELLLSDNNYQQKVAYAIMCGVVEYLGLCEKVASN